MGQENDERTRDEKLFIEAIDQPHLLIVAEKVMIKSTGQMVAAIADEVARRKDRLSYGHNLPLAAVRARPAYF